MQSTSPGPAVIFVNLLCLVLFAAAIPAYADDPLLVQQAFDNMDIRPESPWSFIQTTTGKEEVTVERCDHDLKTCAWTLVSIDGSSPTEKQLKRYRKEKVEAEDRHGERDRFETLASPGSIVLLEEDNEQAVYRFFPLSENEDDKKINEQLEGRLVINKAGPFVASFELNNNDTIKPGMFVKIYKMQIAMRFAPVQEGGPYLPLEMQTLVQGKFGVVKSFDEEKRIQFSDYEL